jgi:hypothetical protein
LWGRHFLVRTDHFSLKYLLDQRLLTVPQHHGSANYSASTSPWNIGRGASTRSRTLCPAMMPRPPPGSCGPLRAILRLPRRCASCYSRCSGRCTAARAPASQ